MRGGLTLRSVYQRLFRRYGPQHWWPGDTPFEIMVGAVLTQNTAWTNVERAIANLVVADCLDPRRIVDLPAARLAELLRPSGYFNVKAARLKSFCEWYLARGGFDALAKLDTPTLRREVLAVNGVGPETADDIVLYAFERPVFVIDAYTYRLFTRLGLIAGDEKYEELRAFFERRLSKEVKLFNEYHALIVRHAKDVCKTRPLCRDCCLVASCAAAKTEQGDIP